MDQQKAPQQIIREALEELRKTRNIRVVDMVVEWERTSNGYKVSKILYTSEANFS